MIFFLVVANREIKGSISSLHHTVFTPGFVRPLLYFRCNKTWPIQGCVSWQNNHRFVFVIIKMRVCITVSYTGLILVILDLGIDLLNFLPSH